MHLLLRDDGVAEFFSDSPVPIEEYVNHVAALQDLIVFSADRPAALLSLTGVMDSGVEVGIHGWSRFAPFRSKARRDYEYLTRFRAEYIDDAIATWWQMRDAFRPITQILASLIYEPWFVESSIGAASAALERLAKIQFPPPVSAPRLTSQEFEVIEETLDALQPALNGKQRAFVNDIRNDSRRTRYEEYVEAAIASLPAEVLVKTQINLANWRVALFAARNDIAHEGAPNPVNAVLFVNESESRALRDATRVILTLLTLAHLSIPAAVLVNAADRLGVRYRVRHVDSYTYAMDPEAH